MSMSESLAISDPKHSGAAVAARLSRNDDSPGKRLKMRREELGLNQKDVAAAMELSRAAYCQYETGSSKLRVDQAEQVASYLRTTPEWIAFGTGERDSDVAARNVKTIEEVVFEGGAFHHKDTWRLNDGWLRDRFGLMPSAMVLMQTPLASPSLRPGDLAVVERGTTPGPAVGEFVLLVDGELMIANVSKLVRTETLRIHESRSQHQDVNADHVKVLGRVVGKLGSL